MPEHCPKVPFTKPLRANASGCLQRRLRQTVRAAATQSLLRPLICSRSDISAQGRQGNRPFRVKSDLFCAENDYRTETLSCPVKPHPDSTSPPAPPATPAIMMDVTVEGHTITAQELQSEDWTPVLYKAYASRPASSPKPPHHAGNATSEAANPNARNAAHDATAATRSGKTPARLPPATKETRLTVQRSKRLPPLPPNAIRVVVRLRGELRLLDVPTPRLTKAVQTQLRIPLPDDFCLRTHPTNNTFTMATAHSPTAETLKTLTSLAIGDQTYPCTAYVAPPPGATRGVITNAYDDETPTQLYQDFVRRNLEYTILAARRMGKTHSILITFDANAVPHSIKYMGAIHRCTLYRGSPDACTNCRQPGHRHDVCPSPKTNLCPRCGTQHSQQDPPCTPKCILCEGPHLTGTGSCKRRNLHQPRKQPSHPETQQQESIPPRDTQISALATGSPISPTPAPTAHQPPPVNPPNDHTLPSHSNPTSSADSLAMEADTEPSTNSTTCTTPPPSTPLSLDDIPTLLESFAARFEAKLQDAVTYINQECATLKDAVINITQDNAALNHRFDVLTQGFSDRYSDLESRLNSYATRLTKLDSTPSRQVIKTLQTHAQQTTRLIRRIANRRAGLPAGRALLSQLSLTAITHPTEGVPLSSILRSNLNIPPIPKNMHPERDGNRRIARAQALHRQYSEDHDVPPLRARERLLSFSDILSYYRDERREYTPPAPSLTIAQAAHWRRLQTRTAPYPLLLHARYPDQFPSSCKLCSKPGDFLHTLLTCPTFPHPPSQTVAESYWETLLTCTSPQDQCWIISSAMRRIALQGLSFAL
ncbi:hypothetical protein HPB49_015909 [Dermacentor silvarum]|uniref:Uncharacterized protein n=1 Tax=Dermacentor silvarum TaxID=543639 RepID=A0ACB8CA75_DERSI|nr:hypothetical protein HPB49_015909 [Dermacentor silvarum]